MTKKFISAVFLLVFVAASVSADTAKVISQYKVHEDTSNAKDVVAQEVSKLEREYTVIRLTSDEWSRNEWRDYIVKLAVDNRSWYANEVGAIYRTNLTSSSGRKYVVFTRINEGRYDERTLEYDFISYTSWAFEIQ
jgi:hypothetical protein